MPRYFALTGLFFIVVTFLGFGLYHLGKFETTDEHLWKYDRIGAYWEAIHQGTWEKTYINDKPGITVALFSGLGLFIEPHPKDSERLALSPEEANLFEAYNTETAESTNLHFRFPVLIVSTLALIGFFILTWLVFKSWSIALFATLFLGLNPIILGMAQIINPDSFFWIFGSLAFLSYLGFILQQKKYFVVLTGILTGFALLSKYTAFLLFPLFGLCLLGTWLFISEVSLGKLSRRSLVQHSLSFIGIFAIASLLFFFFLPATLLDPSLFLKGLSQFFSPKSLPLFILGGLSITAMGWLTWKYVNDEKLARLQTWAIQYQNWLKRIVLGLFFILFILSLANAWSGQRIAPVDALRDAAYANEPQAFNFRPIIEKNAAEPARSFMLSLMEAYPLVFSLSPVLLLLLLVGLIGSWKEYFNRRTQMILFGVSSFALLYILATLSAKVVTNVRYMILLYPPLALVAALILHELIQKFFQEAQQKKIFIISSLVIFMLSVITLWSIRPFYFSYTNFLLPEKQSIHDSWGHGSYEAATYLNSLPQAKQLIIWSNSDTVCRFFVGKCLRSRRIDLTKTTPDYIVMSKRGIIKDRNHFILENNPHPERDTSYYLDKLEQNPVWSLLINNRPDNFIKIVPFEKE